MLFHLSRRDNFHISCREKFVLRFPYFQLWICVCHCKVYHLNNSETLYIGSPFSLLRSYEGTLDGDMSGPGDMYYWGGGAPLAQGERGSMASLDSTLRKGPVPGGWRQPELPEVIAMLNYRLDPVRSNAAAYLQHLTYKNDKVRDASVHITRPKLLSESF